MRLFAEGGRKHLQHLEVAAGKLRRGPGGAIVVRCRRRKTREAIEIRDEAALAEAVARAAMTQLDSENYSEEALRKRLEDGSDEAYKTRVEARLHGHLSVGPRRYTIRGG